MKSVDFRIISRIYGLGRGAVIIPSDFLDIGSRQAVDLALHRLVKKGIIRRLARGLYNYTMHIPVKWASAPPLQALKVLQNDPKGILSSP